MDRAGLVYLSVSIHVCTHMTYFVSLVLKGIQVSSTRVEIKILNFSSSVLFLIECGRIYKSKARGNGEKTEFGEAPWFTAVYIIENGETKFQCGGTIITPYLVISGK